MDSRGPFGFKGSLQDMLMVVSDKTTVLMESTASGTETERKINLLLGADLTSVLFVCFIFREVKKCHWGKKKGYKRMNMIHLQDWHSTPVKLIFLYSQSAADKFKIFWGTF